MPVANRRSMLSMWALSSLTSSKPAGSASGRSNARFKKLAIWPRDTASSGQNLAGSLPQPTVTPQRASA